MCPVCVQFVSTFRQCVTTWGCERYEILCPCVHFSQLEWTHRNAGEKVCFETRVDLVQRSLQPYLIYISISIYRDIFINNWTHGHIDPSPYSLLSAYQILRYVSKPQNEVDTKCTQSVHMGTVLRADGPVGAMCGRMPITTNAHHDGHSGHTATFIVFVGAQHATPCAVRRIGVFVVLITIAWRCHELRA